MRKRRDLLITAALLAIVIAALSLGYRDPMSLTMLLTITAGATTLAWHERDDLALGMAGIVLGPAIEFAATSSGLWTYAAPSAAGLPLWVVPMWWIYPVTVARMIKALSGRRMTNEAPLFAAGMIVIEVTWLCALAGRDAIAAVGTLALLAMFLRRHRTRTDLVAVVICGAIGPVAECVPVWFGAWTYPAGPLLGLPVWLPAGYGVFGASLIQLGLALSRRWQRRSDQAAAQAVDAARDLYDAEAKQRVAGWQP